MSSIESKNDRFTVIQRTLDKSHVKILLLCIYFR